MFGSSIGLLLILLILGIWVLMAASLWKIFQKAGKPGWAAIIPIYNIIVMLEIAGKPWWWVLLMCIPYIGLIWNIWTLNLMVKKFGKNEGFTVGCVIFPYIFLPILAWGDATFTGNEPESIPGVLDSGMQG